MLIKVCVILFVLVLYIKYLETCGGYSFTLTTMQTCINDSVLQISRNNFNATWNRGCNIIINGCLNITKIVRIVKGQYYIKKDHFPPLKGTIDFCDVAEQTQFPTLLQTLRILKISKCPMPAVNTCVTNTAYRNSIAQYKDQLGLLVGTTGVKLDVIHDVGKSCVEFSFTVNRARNS